MGAWKSSDGGNITPVGASSASLSASGDIVSAAANTKGVTIRTAMIYATGATAAYSYFNAGPAVFLLGHNNIPAHLHGEIFVPAGQAVSFTFAGGTATASITYDIH